jgi:hypothetical protein
LRPHISIVWRYGPWWADRFRCKSGPRSTRPICSPRADSLSLPRKAGTVSTVTNSYRKPSCVLSWLRPGRMHRSGAAKSGCYRQISATIHPTSTGPHDLGHSALNPLPPSPSRKKRRLTFGWIPPDDETLTLIGNIAGTFRMAAATRAYRAPDRRARVRQNSAPGRRREWLPACGDL